VLAENRYELQSAPLRVSVAVISQNTSSLTSSCPLSHTERVSLVPDNVMLMALVGEHAHRSQQLWGHRTHSPPSS